MGKLDNKVAFITGVARGQGRSHAIRLAEEGADIIGVDICSEISSVPYGLATESDLDTTIKEVEALDRRIYTRQVDVRDESALREAFDLGVEQVGPVDIVIANAGICPISRDEPHSAWDDVIGVNLTGVFNTVEISIPSMIERGAGGSIVLVSSTAGISGIGGTSRGGLGYTAAKHGIVGLMRSYANNLARYSIRVNTIHPTGVNTPLAGAGEALMEYITAGDESLLNSLSNAMPVEILEPIEISNAVAWLVSDEARYVTGITLPVDAGFINKK
jgi:SDR family mycofactocin-dependent oxidoreductase